MSRSDKDITFVKYRFLKLESSDIYQNIISFCVYLGRAKFALSGRIMLESGFKFKNPNVVDACGCGESIKFDEALFAKT